MIYKRKPLSEMLNEDEAYWRGIDSLVNYVENSNYSIQVPVRLIEQILLIRAWHSLIDMLFDHVSHASLIEFHLKEATYLFPFINISPFKRELERRHTLIKKIYNDHSD